MPGEPTMRPSGSFVSGKAVSDFAESRRVKEAVQQASDKSEIAKEDAEEKKRLEEIEALLPKRIMASFGDISYGLFKERYKDIWDQVANKDHLARGFCMIEQDIAPGCGVTLRTFRTREMRMIRRFAPISNPDKNFDKYVEEEMVYRDVRAAIGVMKFNGTDMPELHIDLNQEAGLWLKSPATSQRIDWLQSFSEELVERISGTLADMAIAYRYALQENLKNQLAPLSRS